MNIPFDIQFLHLDPSAAVETRVRAEVDALIQRYDRISSCHVVIDAPHHHRQHGRDIHVKIDLGVPGFHILVNHEPPIHNLLTHTETGALTKQLQPQPEHKDIYIAIRDAFATVRRRLEDHLDTGHHDHSGPRISDLEAA